jgi:hypothetical protein
MLMNRTALLNTVTIWLGLKSQQKQADKLAKVVFETLVGLLIWIWDGVM